MLRKFKGNLLKRNLLQARVFSPGPGGEERNDY
jgi:hypothetical protein